MNKLGIDDIQFIDRYLSNSDIVYEDVRIEMIDHVASEIEAQMNSGDSRDFYTIFKEYMIENKKNIEHQGGKSFNSKIFKSVSKRFLRNLYSWQVILGSVVCFILFDKLYYFFRDNDMVGSFFPLFLMVFIMIIPIIVFRKKRFTFIGNFGVLICSIFYLNHYMIPNLQVASNLYYINLGLLALFFASGLKTILSLVIFYQKQIKATQLS